MAEELDEIEQMLQDSGNNGAEAVTEDIITDNEDDSGAAVDDVVVDDPDVVVDDNEGDDSGAADEPFDIKAHFDGYESIDQVKAAIERSKAYTPDVEQELETLRQSKAEMESLKAKVDELKSRQPFKNEKFFQLDKLTEQDPEKAAIYQRFMFGDNSDEEVVKLRTMMEHPKRFKENPGFLARQLKAKYADYLGDEFTEEDEQYQDAKTQLAIDADAARAAFNEEIGKVEIPKIKSDEDIKADQQAFVKSWTEPFAEVKASIKDIKIPVLDEKDPTKTVEFMDFPIPEADIKEVQQQAANHIFNQRLEPTKENMKEATDVALAIYLVKNFAKINTAFANQMAKDTGAKWRKRINNPQKAGADANVINTDNKGPEKGSGDDIFDQINNS